MTEIIIRDRRNKGWFYLDNEYLNGYAKLMNPMTTLVYISLCRHAKEDTQECFPSLELISTECNISKPTAIKGIKELEKWNIIKIIREKSVRKNGHQMPNHYVLLDKSVWVNKPRVNDVNPDSRVNLTTEQSKSDDESRVKEVYHKDTNINKTKEQDSISNSQGVADVIKAFADFIDPKNKNYYGNKTQRAAADFLIKEYGLIETIKAIKVLPLLRQRISYLPSITTPCELRDKWTKISDAVNREKLKKEKETPVVIFG